MTIPARYKLKIYQGAALNLPITWKTAAGVVIALSSYSARLQVRETITSTTKLVDLTDVNGGIELADTAPNIRLRLSATATAAMTWTCGVYDLELEPADGEVDRLLEGEAELVHEVTR